MPSEGEQGEGDEGLGGLEAVGDAGEDPNLGVEAYLEPAVVKGMLTSGFASATCR